MNIERALGTKGADIPRIAAYLIKKPEQIETLVEGLKAPKGTLRYGYEKVLRAVSEERPDLVYPFFDVFVELLDCENSFLKWGAILTIGNLAAHDPDRRIEEIFKKYYAPITGPAMVTAANIIGSSAKIAAAKPELTQKITREILKVDKARYEQRGVVSPECRNVVLGQAIDTFDEFYDRIENKSAVIKLVRRQLDNTRKKVVKKAERFLKKHATDRPRKPSARKLSAKKAADETLALLRRKADKARAASYQRYFKEGVDFFGLDTEGARQVKTDLLSRVEGTWTADDAVQFCNAMVRDKHMESRGTGYQVVAHFVADAQPELLAHIKRWLEDFCGNWGLVDNLAPSVLAPLLDRHTELIPEVVAWTASASMWVRRGAAVAFVPLVRKKKHLATAYRIATRLLGDSEDLLHKAVGWLLREAGKTDMARLEKYLLSKGPKIPRTTVRYAIERFPKEERKRLLNATRAGKVE